MTHESRKTWNGIKGDTEETDKDMQKNETDSVSELLYQDLKKFTWTSIGRLILVAPSFLAYLKFAAIDRLPIQPIPLPPGNRIFASD
jgi:hypothetical protein